MRPIPAIIFSDLDGTLLDHHDYRFDEALPALETLRARRVPLILATSKTLAEVAEISRAIGEPAPAIVENGGALCFPVDREYPFEITAHEQRSGYAVIRFSPPYELIRQFIGRQRARHGWQLHGFADMSLEEVAERTGLDRAAAARAKDRMCSEPFVWDDNSAHFADFRHEAEAAQLAVTRGGRFWHLMGQTSKAEALHAIRSLYTNGLQQALAVVALGDSENDRAMLEAADIAVIVKRHDGHHLDCHGIKRTLHTGEPGPAGWNTAVLQLLAEMDAQHPAN